VSLAEFFNTGCLGVIFLGTSSVTSFSNCFIRFCSGVFNAVLGLVSGSASHGSLCATEGSLVVTALRMRGNALSSRFAGVSKPLVFVMSSVIGGVVDIAILLVPWRESRSMIPAELGRLGCSLDPQHTLVHGENANSRGPHACGFAAMI
jgi:hypothetical protein